MVNLKSLLFIILLFLVTNSFAEKRVADSLFNEYNKCKVDSSKVDLALAYANSIIGTDPKKAIYYSKNALTIAHNIHDIQRERMSHEVIGRGLQYIGDISNAMNHYHEALIIANKLKDKNGLADIYINIGFLYAEIGNLKLGIEYYKIAIENFLISNDYKGLCRCYINIAYALYNSNSIDEALTYLQKAKEISEKHDGYRMMSINTNFAEAYFNKKEYNIANEYACKSIETAKLRDNYHILAKDYLILAKIHLAKKELNLAEIQARKGLELAKQTAITKVLMDSYTILYQTLEDEDKFKEAAIYKSLLLNIKDSIQSSVNINLLQAFEYAKNDQEIAIMKAESVREYAELKHQKLLISIFAFALFLVICITGYVFYSSNKLRKTTAELKKAYQLIQDNNQEILLQNQELKNYNQQIVEQSKRIEELNNLKDRLFAIISHDLRSPFNSLKSVLKLLMTRNLSQERVQTIVPMLQKNMSTVSELLDNLLHWSKSQLKGEAIETSNFDMNLVVIKDFDLLETQASVKDIRLINEIPEGTMVFADLNMTEIVIRNLVSNAIKFCRENGTIMISGKKHHDFVEISVTDEGVGISPENLDKIFQDKGRFTTLGTKNESGTGLGLLLCKEFIEKQNGKIGVESIVNKGSRFWFTLPTENVLSILQ